MFFKIVVFKKLAIFTKACNFIKMRLQDRCFPVNIAKFLRSFFTEHLWWLLLKKHKRIKVYRKSV